MDYKKILKDREMRLKILSLTEFIPDKMMLKIQYWIKTGRRLNLTEPHRYNEKIQWYKLYYRDPLMTQCADKYRVREYIKTKGLEDILVPLYGVYDKVEDIYFDYLPNTFVFKTNNGSHTNILCNDKSKFDLNEAKKILDLWLNERTTKAGREWAYYNIYPKIICEKFLEVNDNQGLIDYKFYCFNGKPRYIKIAIDTNGENGPKNGIFNMDFEQLPYIRNEVEKITEPVKKPENYELMCEIARKLSEDFPHVRVDLYNINGKIYFGELTFYDTSGYQIFEPDEFDYILGDLFQINKMIF